MPFARRTTPPANGSVNTGSTPKVQYAYSFAPSGSTNLSRLTSITYPNGRVLTYNYASGLDADISRLSSISDGGTTLESYDYLGYGTVVRRGHAQSGVDLTYIKQTGESDGAAGDKYTGLDAFGRVIDQRWTTNTPTAKDRFTYGYDRDSNRLYKEHILDSTKSELYAYDNLNQITSMQRGTLNGTKTGLTGAATRSQSWDFDALGNFDSVTTNGTTQTRTHNAQNEITGISSATTPTYDANGNLTTDETGRTFKYNAWNRLAEVRNSGGTTLATYKWDGMGRRVSEIRSGTTIDLYYSAQWQVLEERVGGTTRISYAWSPVYVDTLIARDRDSDSNGSLEERLYVAQDASFNVTALIDTSGNVVERYVYDVFGSFSVLTGAWGARANSSYAWKYFYQGGRWDGDGNLYSFRNREYSPTLGRWLQVDPIGYAAKDQNLYRISANNPIIFVDPFGLSYLIGWNSCTPYPGSTWQRGAGRPPASSGVPAPSPAPAPSPPPAPSPVVVAPPAPNLPPDGLLYVNLGAPDHNIVVANGRGGLIALVAEHTYAQYKNRDRLIEIARDHENIHIADLLETNAMAGKYTNGRNVPPGTAVGWVDPIKRYQSELKATDDSLVKIRALRRAERDPAECRLLDDYIKRYEDYRVQMERLLNRKE